MLLSPDIEVQIIHAHTYYGVVSHYMAHTAITCDVVETSIERAQLFTPLHKECTIRLCERARKDSGVHPGHTTKKHDLRATFNHIRSPSIEMHLEGGKIPNNETSKITKGLQFSSLGLQVESLYFKGYSLRGHNLQLANWDFAPHLLVRKTKAKESTVWTLQLRTHL